MKETEIQAELADVREKLEQYPFRAENRRIEALLQSQEGRKLSQEAQHHLSMRILTGTADAIKADPELERLFLREHELCIMLQRQEDPDLYAIEGSVETHRALGGPQEAN